MRTTATRAIPRWPWSFKVSGRDEVDEGGAPTPLARAAGAEGADPRVACEELLDPPLLEAGPLAVDHPDLENPLLPAGVEVGVEHLGHVPGLVEVEVEGPVDGHLHRLPL